MREVEVFYSLFSFLPSCLSLPFSPHEVCCVKAQR